jgi:hypothetical protein
MYLINKRNVTIKATPWLLLYYPSRRDGYTVLGIAVRSFVRVPSIVSIKPENHNNIELWIMNYDAQNWGYN